MTHSAASSQIHALPDSFAALCGTNTSYPSAGALLDEELGALQEAGIEWIGVGGYPEGHPGLGFDCTKTMELLEHKVATLRRKGLRVMVATQFGVEGGDGNLDEDGCAGALTDGSTSAAVADVVGGGGAAVAGGSARETKLQARFEPRVETKVGLEMA